MYVGTWMVKSSYIYVGRRGIPMYMEQGGEDVAIA